MYDVENFPSIIELLRERLYIFTLRMNMRAYGLQVHFT
jgi:hypothetical protein